MSLQEIYYVAEMIVGIAVIVSIVFVAVELRQNTYMLRKSQSDQRRLHFNWLYEANCTDPEFRAWHRRLDADWDKLDEDERYRGLNLGMRSLRLYLDEVTDYFDGQLSKSEWRILQRNMEMAAREPNIQLAYSVIKPAYSEKVQRWFENLDSTVDSFLANAVKTPTDQT